MNRIEALKAAAARLRKPEDREAQDMRHGRGRFTKQRTPAQRQAATEAMRAARAEAKLLELTLERRTSDQDMADLRAMLGTARTVDR